MFARRDQAGNAAPGPSVKLSLPSGSRQEMVARRVVFREGPSLACGPQAAEIYFVGRCDVEAESLTQIISELSTEEQSAVREFIAFLKEQHRQQPTVAFQTALDEFINAHPELLRRLAE